MSAHCYKHGDDLQWVEGEYNAPSYCPSCEVEVLEGVLSDILVCVHNDFSDKWHVAKGKGPAFNAAIRHARAVVAREERGAVEGRDHA